MVFLWLPYEQTPRGGAGRAASREWKLFRDNLGTLEEDHITSQIAKTPSTVRKNVGYTVEYMMKQLWCPYTSRKAALFPLLLTKIMHTCGIAAQFPRVRITYCKNKKKVLKQRQQQPASLYYCVHKNREKRCFSRHTHTQGSKPASVLLLHSIVASLPLPSDSEYALLLLLLFKRP